MYYTLLCNTAYRFHIEHFLLLFYIVACHSLFSQTIQLTAKIVGDNLNEGEGRILVVKAVDSSVVKGSYLETFNVDLRFDASKDTNFLFVVDVPDSSFETERIQDK